MVTLANQIAKRGYRCHLIVANAVGPYLSEVDPSVVVIDLKSPRTFLCVRKLRRYLACEKPVALLSTMTHANAVAGWALRLSRHRCRLVLREANMPDLNTDSLHERIIRWVANPIYRRADRIVCVSQGIRDALGSAMMLRNEDALVVIENPVIIPHGDAQPVAPVATLPVGVEACLAVGRLVPEKGFDMLVDAFSRLVDRPQLHLVILGEGPQREALTKQICKLGLQSRVMLPGFDPDPFTWMRAASIFVLSSRSEGSPNTLIQALACGAPVVSTRLPGSTDILLEHGKYGRLVEFGDVAALADAIRASLDSPLPKPSASWFGRYGLTCVVDHYLDVLVPE